MSYPVWHSDDQKTASVIGSALTLDRPDNVSEGDLLIFLVFLSSRSEITPPSGLTLIRHQAFDFPQIWAYCKIATDDEPSDYTFTDSGLPTWRGVAGRVTGHDEEEPIDKDSGADSDSTTNSLTIPALTATNANSLLISAIGWGGNVSAVNTPTGMTFIWDDPRMGSAKEDIEDSGSTGDRQWSWSTARTVVGLMFNINPADDVPPVVRRRAGFMISI